MPYSLIALPWSFSEIQMAGSSWSRCLYSKVLNILPLHGLTGLHMDEVLKAVGHGELIEYL